MNLTKVLLIWETVPETTTAYVLDVDDATLALLEKAHRVYVNTEEDEVNGEPAMKLWHYLFDEASGAPKYEAFEGTHMDSEIQRFFISGFML